MTSATHVPPDMRNAARAWESTLRATLDLCEELTDEQWELPTECPGWSVKDHASHLVGMERWLLGDPPPAHDLPELKHVQGDFGRFTEIDVDVRRPRPGREVAEELAETVERRIAALSDPSLRPDTEVRGPFGPMPLERVLPLRTFDCWTHEQDIRRAVGRPGGLDGPAARVSVDHYGRVLPRVFARDAGLPAGTTVTVTVTGPTPYAAAVLVQEGRRGVALAEEPDEPTLRVSADTETWMRRAAGRLPADAARLRVDGEPALALRVREALAVTP